MIDSFRSEYLFEQDCNRNQAARKMIFLSFLMCRRQTTHISNKKEMASNESFSTAEWRGVLPTKSWQFKSVSTEKDQKSVNRVLGVFLHREFCK